MANPSAEHTSAPVNPQHAGTDAELPHQAPELHITAERGVLEAPAGAVFADGAIHVFHQFRTKRSNGSRWAHVTASHIPYDWDINDDVLKPEGEELDVLAGSALALPAADGTPETVELIFVTSEPRDANASREELLGSQVANGRRGERTFRIQRAQIDDLATLNEVSDDPKTVAAGVRRLGPIDIDDAAHPVADLVTPSVVPLGEGGWGMLALNLVNDEDAEIVWLLSEDRQHWRVAGAVEIDGDVSLPASRPFAPRLVKMTDQGDGHGYHVLILTYRDDGTWKAEGDEVTGYLVGRIDSHSAGKVTFHPQGEFRVLDHGHDLTRPRIIPGDTPALIGMVGAHPDAGTGADWANCLSTPRAITLLDGALYQDIVGAPQAVHSFSDFGLIWTGQLAPGDGKVELSVRNMDGGEIALITYTKDAVSVTREGETRTASLADPEADVLTVFIDGPLCEVYADGGAATLTSSISAAVPVKDVEVSATGGARTEVSMVTLGRQLQRLHAGLNSAAAQEQIIADSAQADRDLESGAIDDLLDLD